MAIISVANNDTVRPFSVPADNFSTLKSGIPFGELPLHVKVKFGSIYGKPIQWAIKAKNHTGYPTGAITIVTDRIIKLLAIDAKEAGSSDQHQRLYGNSRYIHANIRQWLNKSGHPWFVAQHSTDVAPTKANCGNNNGYDDAPGFLSGFSEEERAAILTTTLTVNNPSLGSQETFTDKIFLLSVAEVGLTGETAEGTKLEGFSDNASRLAYPTADAVANGNPNLTINSPSLWWLRSAPRSYSLRAVSHSGVILDHYNAYDSLIGLRPACNLPSDMLASSGPDEDGCYTLYIGE